MTGTARPSHKPRIDVRAVRVSLFVQSLVTSRDHSSQADETAEFKPKFSALSPTEGLTPSELPGHLELISTTHVFKAGHLTCNQSLYMAVAVKASILNVFFLTGL